MACIEQRKGETSARPIVPIRAGEVARRIIERARRQHSDGLGPFKVVRSGLPSLDAIATSWWGLTVLAGDASSGRTTLAARIALETARAGGQVLWLGIGPGTETPVFRLLTGLSRVRARGVFVDRALTADQWASLEAAASEIGALPILLAEAHGATMEELRTGLQAVLRDGPLELVVLDDMGAPERSFLAGLERLADEFDVPLLAVVSLDRRVAWRDERKVLRGLLPQRPGSLRLRLTRQEPDSILEPEPTAAPLWLDAYRAGEGFRLSIPLRFDPLCRWVEESDDD